MQHWLDLLKNLQAYGIVLGAALLIMAGLVVLYPSVRRKFWPVQRLRRGSWSGVEVFLAFIIKEIAPALAIGVLAAMGFFESDLFTKAPGLMRQVMWGTPLWLLLSLALIVSLLFSMSRTRPQQVGLTSARWQHAVVQGLAGFALVAVPLLLLYFLLTAWIPMQDHGFEKLHKEGLSQVEWGLLLFEACLAAPLLEEILFRGLLQGWLRRASILGHMQICLWTLVFGMLPMLGALENDPNAPPMRIAWQPAVFAVMLVALYGWCFHSVWRGILYEGPLYMMTATPAPAQEPGFEQVADADETEADEDDEEAAAEEPKAVLQIDQARWQTFQAGNMRLAILGSAMLFGMFHSSVWPSPVPLFLLGLALGWLAWRTQSLIGPIVMHVAFNVVAWLVMFMP